MSSLNPTQANNLHVLVDNQDIFKFTLVRHPLERLLFVYIDYFKDPLSLSANQFPNNLKQEIFEKYRPVVYQHWIATGGSYNITISFPEFINYFIESFKELLASQLQPYTQACQPCLLKYQFYGRYRRLQTEISELVRYLGLEDRQWIIQSVTSRNVTDLLAEYYGKLSDVGKSRIYDAVRQELLFYYHLYPGERFSHMRILGVHDHLLINT